jgi:hypothetical protein
MATSVVPAVMAALKGLLIARSGLSGVQVTTGLPMTASTDYVAIMDAIPHVQRTAGARTAPQPREEEFDLVVLISAIRKGDDDGTEVVNRAYAIAAELESEIRNDLTINASLGNGWATVTALPMTQRGPNTDGEREALIEANVSCRARI